MSANCMPAMVENFLKLTCFTIISVAVVKCISGAQPAATKQDEQPGITELSSPGSGIEFSGFFDISWQNVPGVRESSKFYPGAFEIDMEMPVSEKIRGSAALVFQDGTADAGAAFIDFHMFGNGLLRHPPRGGHYLKHSGVMAGKFDVPFGLDYKSYAAPDRKLITPPLTTEKMLSGGWNDTGVHGYFNACCLETCVYYLDSQNLDDTADPQNSIGARMSYIGLAGLEFGGSYASFRDKDNNTSKLLSGVHLAAGPAGIFQITAEYLNGIENKTIAEDRHSGYYFEAALNTKWLFNNESSFVSGYSAWSPEEDYDANGDGITGNDKLGRTSFGLNWFFNKNAIFKAEYLINSEQDGAKQDNDRFSSQLAIRF